MNLKQILKDIEHYSKTSSRIRKHARRLARLQRKKFLALALFIALVTPGLTSTTAHALPEGGNVVAGQASISQSGNTMTVNQSTNKAIINWNSFSIAQKEAFIHNMPSAQAAALHRVIGKGSSQLAGLLKSNGNIFLVNPNGIFIHKGARIEAGGFVATTRDIKDANFMAGNYKFDQAGKAGAQVINQGTISVADAGFAVLVAPTVRNEGVIAGKLAKVVLGSGETFVLDLHGDDLIRFAVDDKAVDSLYTLEGEQVGVENSGEIKTEGGIVVMTAAQLDHIVTNSVNNTGVVMANSATASGGKIIFGASGNIAHSGTASASSSVADGGSVTMIAENKATISGTVEAKGLSAGGRIDISGKQETEVENASIVASGKKGGLVRLGGEFQGGQNLGGVTDEQRHGYKGRFKDAPSLASTQKLTVDEKSKIDAGEDGTAIAWSDGQTVVNGTWLAKYLETSGKYLGVDENIDVKASGLWLLDPDNLEVVARNGASASVGAANAAGGNTSIDANIIEAALRTGDVTLHANNTITVDWDIHWSTSSILTLNATNIEINRSIGNSTSFLDLNATNNISLDNNASVYLNAPMLNLPSVTMTGRSKMFITESTSPAATMFELQGIVNMADNTELHLLAADKTFDIYLNSDMVINGAIKANDDVTINIDGFGGLTLSGDSQDKAGHALQAGRLQTSSGVSVLVDKFGIYANSINLQGSVSGQNNSIATPGITLNAKSPATPLGFDPSVVIKYLQDLNQNNLGEDTQEIINAVVSNDKEMQNNHLSFLQELILRLSPLQLQILLSLRSDYLEFLRHLTYEQIIRLLSLLPPDREKILAAASSGEQLARLLSASDEDLAFLVVLSEEQLTTLLNLSDEYFHALLNLPREQLIALIDLPQETLNDFLSLSVDKQALLLLSQFTNSESLMNLLQSHFELLLTLTPSEIQAFSRLTNENLEFFSSLPEHQKNKVKALALSFTPDAMRSLLSLTPTQFAIIMAQPLDTALAVSNIRKLLLLPQEQIDGLIKYLYFGFSDEQLKNVLNLNSKQLDAMIGVFSEMVSAELKRLDVSGYYFDLVLNMEGLSDSDRHALLLTPDQTAKNLIYQNFHGNRSLNDRDYRGYYVWELVADVKAAFYAGQSVQIDLPPDYIPPQVVTRVFPWIMGEVDLSELGHFGGKDGRRMTSEEQNTQFYLGRDTGAYAYLLFHAPNLMSVANDYDKYNMPMPNMEILWRTEHMKDAMESRGLSYDDGTGKANVQFFLKVMKLHSVMLDDKDPYAHMHVYEQALRDICKEENLPYVESHGGLLGTDLLIKELIHDDAYKKGERKRINWID